MAAIGPPHCVRKFQRINRSLCIQFDVFGHPCAPQNRCSQVALHSATLDAQGATILSLGASIRPVCSSMVGCLDIAGAA